MAHPEPKITRIETAGALRNALHAQAALLSEVLEASDEIVVLAGQDGRVVYANRTARSHYNVTDGQDPLDALRSLMTEDCHRLLEEEISADLDKTGIWTGELTFVTRMGAEVPVAVTMQVHRGDGTSPDVVSTIAHDIGDLKHAQALLEHQATHDSLTGLPNRALFQELGEQALARADREGTTVAVLFLDLDRFKPVNDSLGHSAGDELLVQVAIRLRASLRRGDGVARVGGDEFVVVCEHPAGQPEMLDLANRIITAISEPIRLHGVTARVGASIGIAIGSGGRVTIDTLIRDADAALYQAKERGRGQAVLFGSPYGD